jgi:small subunit ribosomal protein S2
MPQAVVTMKQLLEAGVHFGHQTRRWNPKMRRFIFGERNGIYIIDLNQTLARIDVAYTFVRDLVAEGGTILFVGTKKQTQDPVAHYAAQCGMPYINERWLGGMLTNFTTIAGRVKKMQEYERMVAAGDFEAMPKKEALILSRELDKLQRNLGGIRNMSRLPNVVFVIDTKKEHIAVTEANKLGLPIVAVVDTNCDPDLIQYVIPGNDDAIRAGTLLCRVISDAVEEGRYIAAQRAAKSGAVDPAAAAVPAPIDPEEEARRAEQQREARRQAALQAQEREARLAAARRGDVDPDGSEDTPAESTGTAPEAAAPVAEAAAPVAEAAALAEAEAPVAEAAALAEAEAPAEAVAPAEAPEAVAPAEAPDAAPVGSAGATAPAAEAPDPTDVAANEAIAVEAVVDATGVHLA